MCKDKEQSRLSTSVLKFQTNKGGNSNPGPAVWGMISALTSHHTQTRSHGHFKNTRIRHVRETKAGHQTACTLLYHAILNPIYLIF